MLDKAKENGSKTIVITCNPKASILDKAEQGICVIVGPEAITGSSRMKAGTAQKMVLNMLSTGTMVKLGKTYENYMIDVMPTNLKLRDRATRIVSEISGADNSTAKDILNKCEWKVKTAITMIKCKLKLEEANTLLNNNDGILRKALRAFAKIK